MSDELFQHFSILECHMYISLSIPPSFLLSAQLDEGNGWSINHGVYIAYIVHEKQFVDVTEICRVFPQISILTDQTDNSTSVNHITKDRCHSLTFRACLILIGMEFRGTDRLVKATKISLLFTFENNNDNERLCELNKKINYRVELLDSPHWTLSKYGFRKFLFWMYKGKLIRRILHNKHSLIF